MVRFFDSQRNDNLGVFDKTLPKNFDLLNACNMGGRLATMLLSKKWAESTILQLPFLKEGIIDHLDPLFFNSENSLPITMENKGEDRRFCVDLIEGMGDGGIFMLWIRRYISLHSQVLSRVSYVMI